MELEINKIDDVVSIVLKGRIDANTAPAIEQKLISLISEGAQKLVTDLSEVWFISSAGLKALLVALKEAKREKGDLLLAGVQAEVREVLELTGFSTIFKVYACAEDAAQSFSE
jgi:anti-anti-sigma factor